ncbi:S1C family serine protease [Patescibacteria group bacterium]|nr:S1C family serine protease [Patescibacteria group bacterium]
MDKNPKKKKEKKEIIAKIYQQSFTSPTKSSGVSSKVFFFYLIVSIIAGFLAGFVQDLWFSDYNQIIVPTINTNETKEVLDLNFLLEEDDKVFNQALMQLRSQVVGFYKRRSKDNILDSLYLEKDFLGSGLAVTSDGWLMTHQSVVKEEDYVIITPDKEILEPVKTVIDPFSQTVLVKVLSQNLSPVRFADLDAIKPTDPLLVARYSMQNHGSDLTKTLIQKFAYHDQSQGSDFLLSTEQIDHYLKISSTLDAVYNGGFLLNEHMEVIGMLFDSGKEQIRLAVPSYYLNSTVNNFLESSEEVIRSFLGVRYVDLSEALGLSDKITEGQSKGAVLLGDSENDILAVIDKSPAAVAGLEAGDVILKVNNEDVDEKNSLTKLINDYTPGQELTLTISRAGEGQEIKVILGEL